MSAKSMPMTLPKDIAQQVDLLERVLRAQLEGWRRVLQVLDRQREALRAANGQELEKATLEQQQITKTMVLLDQQRDRLAAALQKHAMPEARRGVPLTQVLQRLAIDEDARARTLSAANELRQTIETAKRRSSIIASAAEALNKHIAGIQQVVHSALSRARVYGRRGKLALGSSTPAAVDMKS